jgi:tRNA threonylcarbamoyladenosine biosynthesis protein TsaE
VENSRPNHESISFPSVIASTSPEETIELGKHLALLLKEGGVIAMRGNLGAGKTCLAKGIARGLGITEEITSPTYTIISEYEGILPDSGANSGLRKTNPAPFYHIDAYRLEGNDDFAAIGGQDIICGNGISVIEWSERIPDFIPKDAIRVDIEITEGGKRLIRLYRGSLKHEYSCP